MKSKIMFSLSLLAMATLLFNPPVAESAMISHLEIDGETQDRIEGSCDMEGREGTIMAYSFGHNVYIPRDTQGTPTGQRVHTPLKIFKEFDKSTPKLYRALITGERLTVRMRFYRIDPTGAEEHYFTILLEQALIVSITPSYPPVFLSENATYKHMETVAFTYRRIQWTWVVDGIEMEDSVEASR